VIKALGVPDDLAQRLVGKGPPRPEAYLFPHRTKTVVYNELGIIRELGTNINSWAALPYWQRILWFYWFELKQEKEQKLRQEGIEEMKREEMRMRNQPRLAISR